MVYDLAVASGTLAPAESCRWYVWFQPNVYYAPTLFQASPYEGNVQVTDHKVLADPPPGIIADLVHSFVVTNVGSSQSTYVLWATFSD
jgi:hypothetical protein